MTMDHAAHAVGVLSLAVFAGAGGFSFYALIVTIAPNWRRMVDALRGPAPIIPESTKMAPRRAAAVAQVRQ